MADNKEVLEIVARLRNEIGGKLDKISKDVRKTGTEVKKTTGFMAKFKGQLVGVAAGAVSVGAGIAIMRRGISQTVRVVRDMSFRMVALAADAQETQGAFDIVFRGVEEDAEASAASIADIGRSVISVKEAMIGFQDTFVPMGFARDDALELSENLVRLGIDLAAFRNQDDKETFTLLSSAIVGNHEAVRRFGIILTEERLKLEAYERGITDSVRELTALEKVQTRVALIFSDSADASGAAAREYDSFNSQVKRLRAGVSSMMTELGGGLVERIQEAIESLGGTDGILTFVQSFLQGIALAGNQAIASLESVGKTMVRVRAMLGDEAAGLATGLSIGAMVQMNR
ncbi:MAG: hypothetical protein ACPGVG_19690, partial [Mycobacterium sp.]